MKQCIVLLLFLSSCFALDEPDPKAHFIGVMPLGLLSATLGANYEYVAAQHHGVFVEGYYTLPLIQEGHGAAGGYRYHFYRPSKGPFIGPVFSYGTLTGKLPDEDRNEYEYTLEYFLSGFDWGYRGTVFDFLNFTFRFGLGYPVATVTWKDQPPEKIGGISIEGIENFMKLATCLDGEITVFWSF